MPDRGGTKRPGGRWLLVLLPPLVVAGKRLPTEAEWEYLAACAKKRCLARRQGSSFVYPGECDGNQYDKTARGTA